MKIQNSLKACINMQYKCTNKVLDKSSKFMGKYNKIQVNTKKGKRRSRKVPEKYR